MKLFKTYLFINICFIFLHICLYLVTIMGLGSGNRDAPRSEVINIMLLFAIIGLSPNLLLFFASVFRKKEIRENALWAAVFSMLILLGYFLAFWPLAMEYSL
ncbi:hypothetical protein ACSFXN_00650 [Planococcus sp. 1R117A]|uniref:hypothetical protein n=1 Tax=Planococcus sp. 1R117A TaxID=3447020 RepID=UPI003EDBF28D